MRNVKFKGVSFDYCTMWNRLPIFPQALSCPRYCLKIANVVYGRCDVIVCSFCNTSEYNSHDVFSVLYQLLVPPGNMPQFKGIL